MKAFGKNLAVLVFGLAVAALMGHGLEGGLNPYFLSILIYAGINVTLAASLNLVTGMAGQFSLGHAGFMSIGAYVSAALSVFCFARLQIVGLAPDASAHLFFLVAILGGGLAAAFFGYLVGLPTLRLKGDYLAIVTLGFGEIIRVVLLNIPAVGGARGLTGIPSLTNLPWVLAVALVCLFCLTRLRASPRGRALLAIRADETAAALMGIPVTRYKVFAFSLGAFFAGLAGALFAHELAYINPKIFDFNRSFEIVIMVVLGGMGSLPGVAVAAVFLTVLREALRPLQEITGVDLRMILYSLILIALMIVRPQGLFGGSWKWRKKPPARAEEKA